MSAPTPWSGPLPILVTGTYLKRQIGVGNLYVGSYAAAGGGGTVFDDLVNPPANGVIAENYSLSVAQAVGTSLLKWGTNAQGNVTAPTSSGTQTNGHTFYTPLIVSNLVKKNFDFVMDFYLENSIARNSSGVPIV